MNKNLAEFQLEHVLPPSFTFSFKDSVRIHGKQESKVLESAKAVYKWLSKEHDPFRGGPPPSGGTTTAAGGRLLWWMVAVVGTRASCRCWPPPPPPTRAPTPWRNIWFGTRPRLAGGVSLSQRSTLNVD